MQSVRGVVLAAATVLLSCAPTEQTEARARELPVASQPFRILGDDASDHLRPENHASDSICALDEEGNLNVLLVRGGPDARSAMSFEEELLAEELLLSFLEGNRLARAWLQDEVRVGRLHAHGDETIAREEAEMLTSQTDEGTWVVKQIDAGYVPFLLEDLRQRPEVKKLAQERDEMRIALGASYVACMTYR